MARRSKVAELEKLKARTRTLITALTVAQEWDLAELAIEIGKRLDQKIQGHKAQQRKKR